MNSLHCLRRCLILASALMFTWIVTACGGSSATRQGMPLTNICTDPNANNTGAPSSCTYSPTPPTLCTDSKANNLGGKLPCTYTYTGAKDNLLISNKVAAAHAEGFTGKNITVGMADMAFNYAGMNYLPLTGKVLSYDTALSNYGWESGNPNLHFQFTAVQLAGRALNNFGGGIAPDAALRWFGVCLSGHKNCRYDASKSPNYLQTLLNYGDVRLVNASFSDNNNGSILTSSNASGWAALLTHDALIVGSAGNQNQSQPGHAWQTPHINSEYYGHFIVAMAVHVDSTGSNPKRASYSNACGVTAQWCIGAVSNIRFPNYTNPYTLDAGAGTSVAAPVITGVAALVLEAYPWMSALNVQQTVLTTATDIGAPGVDPIYGWGLVNAAKAIHGPAEFVRNRFINGFIADFDGGSRPFSNNIKGEGWLRKRGNGTLTLSGNNTYTGGTFVEAGTLRSSGSFGSNVEVAPGATFMTAGNGATIKGNYMIHSPASWNAGKPTSEHKTDRATTAIQLGAPLTITGKATINNSRLLLLRENAGYLVKSTETLITANQGLLGKFAEVNYGSHFFWSADLNYGSHTLTATLTRTSAQAQAMVFHAPANVMDGAAMADTLISYTDALAESGKTTGNEALLSATAKLMSAPDNETAAKSLASLTGEIHSTARVLGIQRAFDNGERLADRLRSLESHQQTGVWLQNASNNASVSRMGYAAADVQYSISGIGADAPFGDHWTLGISAARTYSNAHLDTLGGRLNGMGQQLAVYARRHWASKAYFSSLLSYEAHAVDTQRHVLAGDTLNNVSGQRRDYSTLLRLESGWQFNSGFAPYLAAGTLSLRQSGFSESGVLGLSAGADAFTAGFAELGTRFDRHLGRWTVAVNTSVRRLLGGESGFNVAFSGAEAASFTVTGQSLTGNSVRMSSDLSYQANNGWQFRLGLGAEHGAGYRHAAWSEATARISF